MDIKLVINQMAVLFILIAAGYLLFKIKLLTTDGVKTLTKLVVNFTTPCMILSSVFGDTSHITGNSILNFLLLSLLAFALFYVVALPSARVLSNKKENRGLYCSMIVFGNVGFMGFPVISSIFGEEYVFYAMLFLIIFTLICFSVGILMISGKGGGVDLKLLINASLICAVIAIIILFTRVRIPAVIVSSIELISKINTPCAMLVVGATLATIPVKAVFNNWRLYPLTLIKMIVIPIIVWLVFKPFAADETLFGLLVVLSGMPIAAIMSMFAIEYGNDERAASSGIFLTTLLSAATIPLIVYLLL